MLHDHRKLGHERIALADEPRDADSLAGLLSHCDERHVAVVVEPSEFIELCRREFAHGGEEAQSDILRREAMKESVVFRQRQPGRSDELGSVSASFPAFFRFLGILRHVTPPQGPVTV